MNGRTVLFLLAGMLVATAAFGQMTVVSSVPANGAVGVALSSTVSFTFSEPLDTSRHIGDDGLCVVFLAHDPSDSLEGIGITFSPDRRTISFDLLHTANTDFVWLVSAAWGETGDTLSMPYPLCYTTAANHGAYNVGGTISAEGGGSPAAAVVGLMDQSPFAQGHPSLFAGTVVTNVNGTYTVPFVRPGVYYPICARDGNHDGNMDGEADMIGFYDPEHTGQPQSITVTDADVTNLNLVLSHLNHWTTARENLDTAQAIAASLGSDYHLMVIQSSNDSVGTDGRSRDWSYCYYSAERQRSMNLYIGSMHTEVDTSNNTIYPPNEQTMPLDFMDSDAIMAIADAHGGSLIRTQHDIQQVRLSGGNLQWYVPQDPSLIFWVAEYSWQVSDSVSNTWRVFMDVHTGEVLDIQAVKPIPSGGTVQEFSLLPNYPNPFNPSTTVPFVLPRDSHVDLGVYDVLGREVRTLVNGNMTAGTHLIRFNASDLTSGIYFCRLHAGTVDLTSKMLLMK
jgi:hypothetical protein